MAGGLQRPTAQAGNQGLPTRSALCCWPQLLCLLSCALNCLHTCKFRNAFTPGMSQGDFTVRDHPTFHQHASRGLLSSEICLMWDARCALSGMPCVAAAMMLLILEAHAGREAITTPDLLARLDRLYSNAPTDLAQVSDCNRPAVRQTAFFLNACLHWPSQACQDLMQTALYWNIDALQHGLLQALKVTNFVCSQPGAMLHLSCAGHSQSCL